MRKTIATLGAAVAFAFAFAAMPPSARAIPPHVAEGDDTASCALCHRTKTASTDVSSEWSRAEASATGDASDLDNALLVGLDTVKADTVLCYSCHGVERLGSGSDVQSAFEARSGHLQAPDASEYGRSPKQCSTCHDAHGENKVAGQPRAALLRSIITTNQIYYAGASYCASCHTDRPNDRWDGINVWNDTAHARVLPGPASGTGVICSICHDPHGSDIAPSLEATLMPPAVLPVEGIGISGNDRSLCMACHVSSMRSWAGSSTYAPSAHASSPGTIAITGEWVARDLTSQESSRAVGECQSCHAPMGSSDASGTVPRMLEARGRKLCDGCHDADGPASSNVATLAFPATRLDTEVVAVWRPSAETSSYGDVAVYTRDMTATVPSALEGPRVLRPSGRTGDAAAGDMDGDGKAELYVGDPSRSVIDRYRYDAVRGLKRTSLALPAGVSPAMIAAANTIQNGSGPHGAQDSRAELVVVDRSPVPPYASSMSVYTFTGSALEKLGGTLSLGDDASGLVAGDLTGDGTAEVVVATSGDDALRIYTESGAAMALSSGPHSTGAGSDPRGLSIGEVWASDARNEIVVCYSGLTADNLAVFSGTGILRQKYSTSGAATANRPYDSVVANTLWSDSTAEVVVALRSDPATDVVSATSSIDVFRQTSPGDGLVAPLNYSTGLRYESSAVEAGDIDADGRVEVVVGNSGKWIRGTGHQAPSLQTFDSDAGATLALKRTLMSTGVEQASGIRETTTTALGTAPSVVVADLGAVGPARHPGDAGTVTHVSTETAGFDRHVTCSDCHNSHETTATVRTAAGGLYGALRGVFGVKVTNTGSGSAVSFETTRAVTAEYEVCLKCHSANAQLDGTRDIASEVNTRNASTHAVEGRNAGASVPATTFAPVASGLINSAGSWSSDSQLFCVDCHTNSDAGQAAGPHVSDQGSLLRRPVWGLTAADSDLLCYLCHKSAVYYDGADGSLFRHYGKPDMHKLHTKDTGFSCRTCHVSHGSATLPHLQNADHNYEHNDQGGACTTACHTGGARHAYTRGGVTPPSSVAVFQAAGSSGVDTPTISTRNGVEMVVNESNGTGSDYSIETTFTGLAALPSGIEFYGRYQGSPGHTVNVQAYNYTTPGWVTLGQWPSTAIRGTFSFALPNNSAFLSSGNLRTRVVHSSSGNPTHQHFIDSVWLNP